MGFLDNIKESVKKEYENKYSKSEASDRNEEKGEIKNSEPEKIPGLESSPTRPTSEAKYAGKMSILKKMASDNYVNVQKSSNSVNELQPQENAGETFGGIPAIEPETTTQGYEELTQVIPKERSPTDLSNQEIFEEIELNIRQIYSAISALEEKITRLQALK